MHDCSEAPRLRDDLTDEEKELCSATARFDAIIENLLEKLFTMIDTFGSNPSLNSHNTRQNLTKPRQKNMEELVMEHGIVTLMRSLLKHCSTAIYDVGLFKNGVIKLFSEDTDVLFQLPATYFDR